MSSILAWILLFIPVLYFLRKKLRKKYDYFKSLDVVHESGMIFFGSMLQFIFSGLSFPFYLLHLSDKYRKKKFFGIFSFYGPTFVIQDPDLVKQITVKDFDHFVNRASIIATENDDLLKNSLSLLHDQKWRDMRSTLSPAFTGSKMKMMFDLVRECADDFVSYCKENSKAGAIQISTKDIFAKIGVNIISTTAFGLKVDSIRDENNPVFVNAKKAFDLSEKKTQWNTLILSVSPKLAYFFGVRVTPLDANEFFKKIVKDTIDYRRRENIFRPDVIQLLIQAVDGKLTHEVEENESSIETAVVEESHVGRKVTRTNWGDVEVAAQCFLFFIAGHSTTSTIMTFAAYELALNSDIQERLYQEIEATKSLLKGGPITYEIIKTMEYMDAFISETLRKYPIAFISDRVSNAETIIEDEIGKKFTIPKGAYVWINTIGIHFNHKYFPNPEKFDPDRFLGENKYKIIPNTFIPFGVGPRACIGSRFALMQIKVILYTILSEFSFEVCDETIIPMQFAKSGAFEPARELIVELKQR